MRVHWTLDYSWISETWDERSDGEYTFDGETFHDIPAMTTTRYCQKVSNKTPVYFVKNIFYLFFRRHACVAIIDEEWLFVAGGYNPNAPHNLVRI